MMAMEEFHHVIIGRIIFLTQFYHFIPELREITIHSYIQGKLSLRVQYAK